MLLTLLLVAFLVIDWLAVVALHRLVRWYPRIAALRERRRIAWGVALLGTGFAALALARLTELDVPPAVAAVVLVGGVAVVSVVNGLFLWQYRDALLGPPPPTED